MELKIPVISQQPEFVLDGALLSFDPNRTEIYRRLAYYVDTKAHSRARYRSRSRTRAG
jgi:ABC-type uncharacterized transport system substrate-binding protein